VVNFIENFQYFTCKIEGPQISRNNPFPGAPAQANARLWKIPFGHRVSRSGVKVVKGQPVLLHIEMPLDPEAQPAKDQE